MNVENSWMNEPVEERFKLLHEFYAAARDRLPPGSWDYLRGASETETTFRRNRAAFDTIAFRPRVLRDVEHVDPCTRILGHDLALPLMLAPIGSLQDFDPDGAAAAARAANGFGIPIILSSVSQPGLEATARAASGPKIYQLYIRGDRDWVDERVAQAQQAGYAALCITVDLDYYAKRERDIAKRYVTTARRGPSRDHFQQRFTWSDLDRLRDTFGLPILVKGIATAEDARIAVDHAVSVVYVSNHGGRELDHGLGALDVLPEVVEAVAGRVPVMMDGGILRGTDVVKAMALGASAVAIGRLYGFALAAAGEEGVRRMLDILAAEIRSCLGLLGVTGWSELGPEYLSRGALPVSGAGYSAVFPLLEEGY
jgi:glycolate oxidase